MSGDFWLTSSTTRKCVGGYLRLIANELFRRVVEHDNSKLGPKDCEMFASL
jgi:hypothetical protein